MLRANMLRINPFRKLKFTYLKIKNKYIMYNLRRHYTYDEIVTLVREDNKKRYVQMLESRRDSG